MVALILTKHRELEPKMIKNQIDRREKSLKTTVRYTSSRYARNERIVRVVACHVTHSISSQIVLISWFVHLPQIEQMEPFLIQFF